MFFFVVIYSITGSNAVVKDKILILIFAITSHYSVLDGGSLGLSAATPAAIVALHHHHHLLLGENEQMSFSSLYFS